MPPYPEPEVVCRPALPSDTADVLAFTRRIWEGRDYIHLVWDEWLADPTGILVSAQFGARIVGIAKVTPIFPGQWWLHGLRVDPQYQGRKIGSHLHEYADRWWLEHGGGTIRLLTSTQRVQVHRLCARTGYARVGEVAQYRFELKAPADHADLGGAFSPVSAEEVGSALAFTRQYNTHAGGLMDTGWRFVLPDEAVLASLASQARLHWWRDREGLLATWIDDDDDYAVLGLGFAAVRDSNLMADLLRASVGLAARHPVGAVFWLAPAAASVEEALKNAGFTSDDDHGYLFEKLHPV